MQISHPSSSDDLHTSTKSHVVALLLGVIGSISILSILFYTSLDTSSNPSSLSYISRHSQLSKYVPELTMSYTNCSNKEGVLSHLAATASSESFLYAFEYSRIHPCCVTFADQVDSTPSSVTAYTDSEGYGSLISGPTIDTTLTPPDTLITTYVHTNLPSAQSLLPLTPPTRAAILNDIHVVILSAPGREEYVAAALNTWASGLPHVSVVSNADSAVPSGFMQWLMGGDGDAEAADRAYMYAISQLAAETGSSVAPWMLIVRDNTYVNTAQLGMQLRQFRPHVPVALGHVRAAAWTEAAEHLALESGLLLSAPALTPLQGLLGTRCPFTLTAGYSLTQCLWTHHVQLVHAPWLAARAAAALSADAHMPVRASADAGPAGLVGSAAWVTHAAASVRGVWALHAHIGQRGGARVSNVALDTAASADGAVPGLRLSDTRTRIGVMLVGSHGSRGSLAREDRVLVFPRVPVHVRVEIDHSKLKTGHGNGDMDRVEDMSPSDVAALIAKHPLAPKTMLPFHRQIGGLRVHDKEGYSQLGMTYPADKKKTVKP